VNDAAILLVLGASASGAGGFLPAAMSVAGWERREKRLHFQHSQSQRRRGAIILLGVVSFPSLVICPIRGQVSFLNLLQLGSDTRVT